MPLPLGSRHVASAPQPGSAATGHDQLLLPIILCNNISSHKDNDSDNTGISDRDRDNDGGHRPRLGRLGH